MKNIAFWMLLSALFAPYTGAQVHTSQQMGRFLPGRKR